jgi:hypothetical protein
MGKHVHGLAGHRLYGTYRQMLNRCSNPKSMAFRYYGGSGIDVCDEWKGDEGLERFIEWADGIDPFDKTGLEIDRKKTSESYSPENCHFVTRTAQNRNTRSNTWVTFNGEAMLLIECFEKFGNPDISYNTAWTWHYKGWPVCDAISKPKQKEGTR